MSQPNEDDLPLLEAGEAAVAVQPPASYSQFLIYSASLEAVQLGTLSLYLPLSLEQFARDNGFLTDRTTACASQEGCQVSILGLWVNTASFSLFTSSFGVFVQAFTAISLGDFADSSNNRSKLLYRASLALAVTATLFLLLDSGSPVWILIIPFNIIIYLSHSITSICQNAVIPILARQRVDKLDADEISRETAKISARGIAIGYMYGLVFLVLSQIPAQIYKGSFGMRIAIACSGAQLAILTVYAKFVTPDTTSREAVKINIGRAWAEVYRLARQARQLRETLKYLLYWMIISDGFATISSSAILYAKTALQMQTGSIILVGIEVPICSLISTLLWPRFALWANRSSHKMLILLTELTAVIPLYACLGFVPFIRDARSFGSFTSPLEMYVIAAWYGLVHGAFHAYARSVFAELIPPGYEARFFGLYSITSKSTAFLGPMLVGVASQMTGSMRAGFIVLLLGIVLPLPLLMSVDMEKGRHDAVQYSQMHSGIQ